MNNGLMLGLQGITLGKKYGYGADVEKLADDLCRAKQNLRRLHHLKSEGRTKAPSGLDLDYCITVCTEKLARRQADYDRAKAEE